MSSPAETEPTPDGGRNRDVRGRRGLGIRPALVAAVVVAITGGALFGAIQLSQNVARASVTLHNADEAARAATVARSHIALAALGSEDQRQLSAQEARNALAALERSLNQLDGYPDASRAVDDAFAFHAVAQDAVEAMIAGAPTQTAVDFRFREAMTSLDELRLGLVAYVDLLGSAYNAFGIALGIAMVGLVPLVLVMWTRAMARKSMEVRELSLRLQHEGEVRDAHNTVLRTVVHEFRTPLTGISGLAAVLEDPSFRVSDEAAEMVSMIRTEAEDMSQLTDDILASAALESGQLEIRVEPVDVVEAANRAIATFQQRGIHIEVSLEPAIVMADELRFRQILKNLISNAVKYGGPTIKVSGSEGLDLYTLQVADDGPGIPEEIAERIFDPFPHGGSGAPTESVGLGLFIVKQLSEAMGGTVAHDREGQVTTFTVCLPTVASQSAMVIQLPAMGRGA